jgi:glycine hydroxymethyltransferase
MEELKTCQLYKYDRDFFLVVKNTADYFAKEFIEEELDRMNITCNKNAIPFDTKNRIQTSGIRLGTAAVTSRGFKETEIVFLSQLINQILQDIKNNTLTEKNKKEYKEEVIALCSKYPIY